MARTFVAPTPADLADFAADGALYTLPDLGLVVRARRVGDAFATVFARWHWHPVEARGEFRVVDYADGWTAREVAETARAFGGRRLRLPTFAPTLA